MLSNFAINVSFLTNSRFQNYKFIVLVFLSLAYPAWSEAKGLRNMGMIHYINESTNVFSAKIIKETFNESESAGFSADRAAAYTRKSSCKIKCVFIKIGNYSYLS